MPRSAKDSEEEVETKTGRRTRALSGQFVIDSPVRRSTRLKLPSKISPESSPSDSSCVSDTQTSKTMRRRAGTIGHEPASLTLQKSLRSRRGSMSSEVSEVLEMDVMLGTPTRRTRSSMSSNIPKSRATKNQGRAGSETKSPPEVRVTRQTRSNSVEPESMADSKIMEKNKGESINTPGRTRKRASILPSEETVIEEKEAKKVAVVQLERVLTQIQEDTEKESSSIASDASSVSHKNLDSPRSKEDAIVKGLPNNSADSSIILVEDTSVPVAGILLHSDSIDKKSEKTEAGAFVNKMSNSVERSSSECNNPDTSIKLGLQIEDLLNISIEERERSLNNKENQTANIICDTSERNAATISPVLSQTQKQFGANTLFTSPLTKYNIHSTNNDANRFSNESIQILKDSDVSNDSIVLIEDVTFAMQNEKNTDHTESVNANEDKIDSKNEIEFNKCSEKNNLSTSGTENSKKEIETETEMTQSAEISCINAVSCEEDLKSETVRNTCQTRENETVESLTKADESEVQQESTKPEIINDTEKKDALIENSYLDEIVSSQLSDLSGRPSNQNDSAPANKNEDDLIDVVKSSKSSVVTESSAEPCEELPNNEEPARETSELDTSLTPKSAVNEGKLDVGREVCNKSQEKMDVDNNTSDASEENLFQDIPADEWEKESIKKRLDADSNSLSSEKGEENETEEEYEIVLVKKEAWLASEKLKMEKNSEPFDYDSDDTVVIKSRQDALKSRLAEKMHGIREEESEEKTEDETPQTSSQRKSLTQKKETASEANKDEENAEESQEKANTSGSKLNISSRLSLKQRSSSKFNKSKDANESSTSRHSEILENEANTSKNKNDRNETSSEREEEEICMAESIEKRKSLNTSKSRDSDANKSVRSNSINIHETSSTQNERKISLSGSARKPIKSFQLNESDESDSSDSKIFGVQEKKIDSLKRNKFGQNFSTVAQVGSSDSETSTNGEPNDSDDNRNKLPKFLMSAAVSSDEEAEELVYKSLDFDIEREYNLKGEIVSKFSDDDVPGDECRASESEDSDPEDNGADLLDFIVADDELVGEDDEDFVDDSEVEEDVEVVEDEEEDIIGAEDNNEEKEKEIRKDIVSLETDEEQNEVHLKMDESDTEDEKTISKSLETSKKQHNDSVETSRKKMSFVLTPQTTTNEEGTNSSRTLISSFSKKKKNTPKSAEPDEFAEKLSEQQLNETEMRFRKKIFKFGNSMECSTPKVSSLKRQKHAIQNLDSSLEGGRRKSIINESVEKNVTGKCRSADTFFTVENSFGKLNEETSQIPDEMNKSLPMDLKDLVEKTKHSKPKLSRLTFLNRSTLDVGSDTPRTKFLRKDKLNESAPTLNTDIEYKKLENSGKKNVVEAEETVEKSCKETSQEVNVTLKKTMLKLANDILDVENKKTKKKRKKLRAKKNSSQSNSNTQEYIDSETTKKIEEQFVFNITDDADQSEDTNKVADKKKKKKKKRKTSVEAIEIAVPESDIVDKKPLKENRKRKDTQENGEIDSKPVIEKKRKKNDKNKEIGEATNNSTDTENYRESKKMKLNIEKWMPQLEKVSVEKTLKDKSKSAKHIPLKVTSADKLPRKLQKSEDQLSDSDEAPELIAFSKAREAALAVAKHAADNIKANKEMRRLKQKEHLEKMQQEKEAKIEKQNIKRKRSKTEKVEVSKSGLARLPEELLKNLPDTPPRPTKKRKLTAKIEDPKSIRLIKDKEDSMSLSYCGNTTHFDVVKIKKHTAPKKSSSALSFKQNMIEDKEDSMSISSCGSTTHFDVVRIKKHTAPKRSSSAILFRQKMIARNARQPISAYMMYLEKQKSSGKGKFHKAS